MSGTRVQRERRFAATAVTGNAAGKPKMRAISIGKVSQGRGIYCFNPDVNARISFAESTTLTCERR